MDLTRKQWIILGVGAVLVGGGIWWAYCQVGGADTDSSGRAPRVESGPAAGLVGLSAKVNALGISPDGGFTQESRLLHFFNPDHPMNPDNCDYKNYVRHRYPTISGTNISTLIHHGYSPLMVPSVRDYHWLVDPPADSGFVR